MPMVSVLVNDMPISFEKETPLSEVLAKMSLAQKQGIAVAVNFEVIPRSEWSDIIIKNNDKVMVIQATQGG